jgi:hypothetical protein
MCPLGVYPVGGLVGEGGREGAMRFWSTFFPAQKDKEIERAMGLGKCRKWGVAPELRYMYTRFLSV